MSSCLATGATCGTAPTAKALLPGAYGFSVAAVGLGSNYASGHRKAAAGKGFLGKMVRVSTSRFSARRINVSNHREGNFVSKSPQSRMLKPIAQTRHWRSQERRASVKRAMATTRTRLDQEVRKKTKHDVTGICGSWPLKTECGTHTAGLSEAETAARRRHQPRF